MREVLGHAESEIFKTAGDTSVVKYLNDIQMIDEEDCLPGFIPPTVCLQHYVSLRLLLRK